MFTQFLGTLATVYGVLAALKSLLQTRQMLARRTSGDVSAGFLASYAGGYAIWLAYGLSTGSIPLIVVDAVGLLCGGLTLAVALSLRGSLIRPATWNGRNTLAGGLQTDALWPGQQRQSNPRASAVIEAAECTRREDDPAMRRGTDWPTEPSKLL